MDNLTAHTYLRYHYCWAKRIGGASTVHSLETSDEGTDGELSEADMSISGGSASETGDSDGASVRSASSSRRSRAPGPHAVPIVWGGLRNVQHSEPTGSIRFDAESVYSYTASMGSEVESVQASDSVSQR